MSDTPAEDSAPIKKSKLPVIIVVVLMLLLGGGGFFAMYSGLISFDSHEAGHEELATPLPAVEFIPLEPIIISLGKNANARHLKFTAHLEVAAQYKKDVETLSPRIMDILNGYLRAVEVQQLEDPSALPKLKAQMLRRIQIVTGDGRVRDLLVAEFILN